MKQTARHGRWRRRPCRILLLFGIALVSASFFFLLPRQSPKPKKRKIIPVNPHFTILDKPSSEKQSINQLRKPFQWYRDNWHRPSDTDAWQSTNLPQWMKDYFVWHREQTRNPFPSQQYLILQCLEQDRQCGGLADRLLALPFLVLLASQSQRILLIVWTVPFPLEEFLMPNVINWMLPTINTREEISQQSILSGPSIIDKTVFTRVQTIVAAVNEPSLPVVGARLQDYASAWEYYDQYHQNQQHTASSSTATQHYRDLFSVMFVPSPPLSDAMSKQHIPWNDKDTAPYSAAHYRALYGPQTPPPSFLQAAAKNAVHCASSLLPGKRVAFLSDSVEAVTTIEQSFGRKIWILHASSSRPILHLDKATRKDPEAVFEPSDFYDTFLDLFVMAGAQCVSYGQGGFAKMGNLLSKNRSCTNRHFEGGRMVEC